MTAPGDTITVAIMALQTTIDAAGRVVIPKVLREQLHLAGGAQVTCLVRDGHLILSPVPNEPTLVEVNGLYAVQTAADHAGLDADAAQTREHRLRQLVDYAMQR